MNISLYGMRYACYQCEHRKVRFTMKLLIIITATLFLATVGFSKEANKKTHFRTTNETGFLNGQVTLSSNDIASIPKYFQVKQNYPNPFNAITVIEYTIPKRANTTLKIYNSLGELITILENGIKEAGSYRIEWDGKNFSRNVVSSGVYFYVVAADNFYSVKKMVLLK